MRPDSIPPSYNKFIVNCGPIDEVVLQAVRDNIRGRAVDAPTLRKYLVARAKKPGFFGRVRSPARVERFAGRTRTLNARCMSQLD